MLKTPSALRSQAAGILHEISVLQERIQELHIELEPVQAHLDAIAYPVLTLPPEITSEIFVHCLPDALGSRDAPMAPNCTLHKLSTPRLWTRLDLSCIRRQKHALDIAQTWLHHSRHHPLSVAIEGLIADQNEAFFEAVCQHAPGVRSLKLDVCIYDWVRMPTLADFSHLRELSLHLIEVEEDEEAPEVRVEMFQTAPELDRLLLDQIPSRLLVLPWNHVRSFTGKLYNITECMEALAKMPNLTECSLSMFKTKSDFDANQVDVLSHPAMRTFTLFLSFSATSHSAAEYTANSVEFLRFVTFPNLENLEFLEVDPSDLEDTLVSFLERGSPPLKRLVARPEEYAWIYPYLKADKTPFVQSHLTSLQIWYIPREFGIISSELIQSFSPGSKTFISIAGIEEMNTRTSRYSPLGRNLW
ncbi:hypothetical protein FB45DRAFT_1055454 [Roridomyces roridus]|uniref:F-box domain-containing protein n=1 Tax=Roridomyces roridus TaxID=1738132 RepID=A0AAD7FRR6_9AGAR|nr:hypothetical protein FB45DRAFT_1055454 [Roridomyces roridus]